MVGWLHGFWACSTTSIVGSSSRVHGLSPKENKRLGSHNYFRDHILVTRNPLASPHPLKASTSSHKLPGGEEDY